MFVERLLLAARKRFVTIDDHVSVIEAAKLLLDGHTDLFVVCSCDELVAGVNTKMDVVRQMSLCQGSWCTIAASSVMTRTVIHYQPNDVLQNIWSIIKDGGLKNIPVIDQNSRPIGVLNTRNALEVPREEVEEVLPVDADNAEVILADFTRLGVDTVALAAQLQREGTESFDKSWSDLMSRIASKSAQLGTVDRKRTGSP